MFKTKPGFSHKPNYYNKYIPRNKLQYYLVVDNIVSIIFFFLFILLTLFFTSAPVWAETNSPTVEKQDSVNNLPPKNDTGIKKAILPLKVGKEIEGKLALNETIVLTVENLDKWLEKTDTDLSKFVLKIDGNDFPDLSATPIKNNTKLQFDLKLSQANKKEWTTILNRKSKKTKRRVSVTVRYPNTHINGEATAFLIPVSEYKLTWFTGVSLLSIISFLILAFKTDIIRVPGPQPDGINEETSKPYRKPFSLGRTQMAFWFFTVIISFVFIWLAIGDLETLTATVLGLMGISAATGLSSAVVDSTKKDEEEKKQQGLELKKQRNEVEAEKIRKEVVEVEKIIAETSDSDVEKKNELMDKVVKGKKELSAKQKQIKQDADTIEKYKAGMQTRVSQSFIKDILSDDDGISFHRFQMFSWTIVLIIIFIESVYKTLAMPDFDTTLLGLMGLSGATYIGFKLPKIES